MNDAVDIGNINEMKLASVALAESGVPICRATLRRHLNQGRIAAERIGGRWFTSAAAIRAGLVRKSGPSDAASAAS